MILPNLEFLFKSVSDLATGGSIGSATTTVDVTSTIRLNQTTAGQSITIPSPTVTTNNRILWLANIGSASVTVSTTGSTLNASKVLQIMWNGTAWVAGMDTDTGTLKYYVQQTLAAGNNTITHSLALAQPEAINVMIRDVATGQLVEVPVTTYATNSIIVNAVSAVANANITIIG